MSVTGAIRFVIGAALVAAGASLVGPLAVRLAAAARMSDPAATRGVPWAGPTAGVPVATSPAAPAGQPLSSAAGTVPSDDPWTALPALPGPDSAGGLQLDRYPPPPPAPLPPAPPEMSQTSPPLGAAYRSTLRVPPPDLLDAEAPPPTAAWAASPVAASAARGGTTPPAVVPANDVAVPATYRVRDGDDLSGIAGRFYGHPSAASAIWAANREAIVDPDLLPIGVELRMPPRWAVEGRRRPGSGSIEPAAFARPSAPAGEGGRATHVPGSAAWLAPFPGAALPSPPQSHPLQPTSTIASVRAGPGETLAALARRVYGDPGMAEQIFAVNRDRLRSPDLLVAGTELRLPRPVTAPGP